MLFPVLVECSRKAACIESFNSFLTPEFGDRMPIHPGKDRNGSLVGTPNTAKCFRLRVSRCAFAMAAVAISGKPGDTPNKIPHARRP